MTLCKTFIIITITITDLTRLFTTMYDFLQRIYARLENDGEGIHCITKWKI